MAGTRSCSTESQDTRRISICSSPVHEDAAKISEALAEFGFPLSEEVAKELLLPNRMISIGRAPSRIDILNQVTGLDFETAYAGRNVVDVSGVPVAFISLENLIESKLATGRPQDLLDLEQLEKVRPKRP